MATKQERVKDLTAFLTAKDFKYSVQENDRVNMGFNLDNTDSIDVIMLGSSPTYSGFASGYAYEKFGFTSYPYALSGSSCNMWKPAMQNILRTQKPRLVVVDIFGDVHGDIAAVALGPTVLPQITSHFGYLLYLAAQGVAAFQNTFHCAFLVLFDLFLMQK